MAAGGAKFELRIRGPNTNPDEIDIFELMEVMGAFAFAAKETARSLGVPVEQSGPVSLVGIESGSTRPALEAAKAYMRAFALVFAAAQTGNWDAIPDSSRVKISKAQKKFQQRNRVIHVVYKGKESNAVGDPAPNSKVEKAQPLTNFTTIYAKLVRVGGDSPQADLRLDTGETIKASISEDQAKSLGKNLYKIVGLKGSARLDSETLAISTFDVDEILDYQGGSLIGAFDELARIVDGAFDGVDAEAFVEEQRKD